MTGFTAAGLGSPGIKYLANEKVASPASALTSALRPSLLALPRSSGLAVTSHGSPASITLSQATGRIRGKAALVLGVGSVISTGTSPAPRTHVVNADRMVATVGPGATMGGNTQVMIDFFNDMFVLLTMF